MSLDVSNKVQLESAVKRSRWRRALQFDLRTALLGLTLLSVVFAVGIVPAQRQRSAVLRIKQLNGWVQYTTVNNSESRFVRGLRNWLPRDYFDSVIAIDLSNERLDNDDMASIAVLDKLEDLNLSSTLVSDEGLAHLSGLTNLVHLNLQRTSVSDEGLAHLSGLTNLVDLNLQRTSISDDGLRHLSSMSKLEYLRLGETQVSISGIRHLKDITTLKYLRVGDSGCTIQEIEAILPRKAMIVRVVGPSR